MGQKTAGHWPVGGGFEGGAGRSLLSPASMSCALRRKRRHEGLGCSQILVAEPHAQGLPKREYFRVDEGETDGGVGGERVDEKGGKEETETSDSPDHHPGCCTRTAPIDNHLPLSDSTLSTTTSPVL